LREEVMRQTAAIGIAFSDKAEDREAALNSAVPAPELPFAGEEGEEAAERVGNGFVQDQWWPDQPTATVD
jgi:hypothetical protein